MNISKCLESDYRVVSSLPFYFIRDKDLRLLFFENGIYVSVETEYKNKDCLGRESWIPKSYSIYSDDIRSILMCIYNKLNINLLVLMTVSYRIVFSQKNIKRSRFSWLFLKSKKDEVCTSISIEKKRINLTGEIYWEDVSYCENDWNDLLKEIILGHLVICASGEKISLSDYAVKIDMV